ncbi:uncharacterized protein TNCV_3100681 [Trichonephila clavipes]|nr:uncharacterized protein TNCV_3100681 [Trichonephila clavipes]
MFRSPREPERSVRSPPQPTRGEGGKWCPGDTFCVPFGPRFAVDGRQKVSAADKGCRVYSLDLRLDAVSPYSGCTPVITQQRSVAEVSPFAIQKALKGIGGDLKSVRKLRSGNLLIETASAVQSKSFLLVKTFLDSTLTVTPHKSFNFSQSVISEPDLLYTSKTEIFEGLSDQGVTQCFFFSDSSTSGVGPGLLKNISPRQSFASYGSHRFSIFKISKSLLMKSIRPSLDVPLG